MNLMKKHEDVSQNEAIANRYVEGELSSPDILGGPIAV